LSFQVSPTAFFQTNVGAASALVQLVTAFARSASRILDLYCGSGLFTLPLARSGATITAVEENGQAIADLKANLELNRISGQRVRPLCGRAEDVVMKVARQRFDAVVLDPPRDGCSPRVVDAVFRRIAPPRAVYVACNPDALARELPAVRDAGYTIERLQPIDMFPHTEHVEVVASLRHDRGFDRGIPAP